VFIEKFPKFFQIVVNKLLCLFLIYNSREDFLKSLFHFNLQFLEVEPFNPWWYHFVRDYKLENIFRKRDELYEEPVPLKTGDLILLVGDLSQLAHQRPNEVALEKLPLRQCEYRGPGRRRLLQLKKYERFVTDC